jgi:hypothetical protein
MVKKRENERPNINRIEKEWKQILEGLELMLIDLIDYIINLLLLTEKDAVSIKPSSSSTASAYYSDDDIASSIKNIEIKDKKSGYFILDLDFLEIISYFKGVLN